MNKILTLAAGATVLFGATLGISTQAFAQAAAPATTGAASGPFADVPADHWAYSAVNTLQKAGIVIGYPDGTYGGRRAMTRYEFAVAIARLLPMVQNQIDTSQFVKTGDFQAFQNDVNNRLQQQQAALDALRALVNEFQPELEKLGADVAAINKRLDADEQRLAVVEEEQRRVKINGEFNVIGRSNISDSSTDNTPLDQNGYRIGTKGDKSLFSNINVYHDFLLSIDGRVSDNTHAIVKIDAGNYLSSLGSYESLDPLRDENTTPVADTFSIYQAYIDAPVSFGGMSGAEAQIGRVGEQFTPFTLKAIDPDVYTNLPETNSGDVGVDGLKLGFGAGPAHVQLYAGKNAPIDNAVLDGGPNIFAASGAHRPGSVTAFYGAGGNTFPANAIDQSAGARITVGTPDTFVVGVTGLIARTTGDAGPLVGPYGAPSNIDPYKNKPYNNLSVYGADFSGTLPFVKKSGLTLDGEVAVSPTGLDSRFGNVNSTKGDEAYYGELGYTFGPLVVKGGYKDIYTNFAAPGYWGRLGSWTNPTNVHGGIVSASYAITPDISLVGNGNFFQGQYNVGNTSPLGKNDKLDQYQVGVKYGLSSSSNVDLGYEWVQYDLKNDQHLLTAAGKPTEQYITLGVGHSFSQSASLKLLYQIIDYKDKNTGFDPAGDSKGGVALTQFSVKF